MITAELTKGQIQALLEVAPKDDVRYYMNGACLDADKQLAIATDGHMLISFPVELQGSGQAIIDRETLQHVVRTMGRKAGSATLDCHDGKVSVTVNGTSIESQLIDGTYPDYARVITAEPSGEPAHYNPDYLARIGKAFNRLGAASPVEVTQNGAGPGLVAHPSIENAVAVVMPFRPVGVNVGERVRALLQCEHKEAA